jgi:hypothetical protein
LLRVDCGVVGPLCGALRNSACGPIADRFAARIGADSAHGSANSASVNGGPRDGPSVIDPEASIPRVNHDLDRHAL